MHNTKDEILVWLPSPMGDAVLCTPALRAIREHFGSSAICFLARPAVREILSPNPFNDTWLTFQNGNPFKIAQMLRPRKFTQAILFKNSFASALAVFLAQIPSRVGYAREGRAPLLTSRLHPPKISLAGFKPSSMIDYYLAIASWIGCDTFDRNLELCVDPRHAETFKARLAELFESRGPIVVMVPGGAFGPSKCWPPDRFARTADWLILKYGAEVVVSVSPDAAEKHIANMIQQSSANKLINLAERPLTLGELKALFSHAELVISNDTGPRHIAVALRRKIVTLFGPNDPAWTNSGWEHEIQLIGRAPCAPCARPVCREKQHLCMEAITVQMVCDAAKKLIENNTERCKP